jgi:5-methylcytosine-specific restriction endonuclease McrA
VTFAVSLGDKYGFWTVLERSANKVFPSGSYISMWDCRCDCGETATVSGTTLFTGKSKSCGCRTGSNLIGRRFDRFVVTGGPEIKKRKRYWICRCDCGNERVVYAGSLVRGLSGGCGCGHRKTDLSGQRFGRLVAIEMAERRSGVAYWLCQCDCGTRKIIWLGSLQKGDTISCGCVRRGEWGGAPLMPQATRDKDAVRRARRRARKKNAGGSYTVGDIADIRRMQRDRCAEPTCRVKLQASGHRDHIVSLAQGGSNNRRNIQLLCAPCNQKKHAKDPLEWARRLGRLL